MSQDVVSKRAATVRAKVRAILVLVALIAGALVAWLTMDR
jgi:hypothetical protein